MSIDDFSDMLPHTVQIAAPSSVNTYGEISFGTAVSYKARIVGAIQTVTDVAGRDRVSKYKVTLQTANMINPDSQITLPSGYTPQQPRILSVGSYPDELGNHHTVIYLG